MSGSSSSSSAPPRRITLPPQDRQRVLVAACGAVQELGQLCSTTSFRNTLLNEQYVNALVEKEDTITQSLQSVERLSQLLDQIQQLNTSLYTNLQNLHAVNGVCVQMD
eukprot:g46600.t1